MDCNERLAYAASGFDVDGRLPTVFVVLFSDDINDAALGYIHRRFYQQPLMMLRTCFQKFTILSYSRSPQPNMSLALPEDSMRAAIIKSCRAQL
jgi:hypothetical protein